MNGIYVIQNLVKLSLYPEQQLFLQTIQAIMKITSIATWETDKLLLRVQITRYTKLIRLIEMRDLPCEEQRW